MCGKATLAMEAPSTFMKVARVTVTATIHGLNVGLLTAGSAFVLSFACAMASRAAPLALRTFPGGVIQVFSGHCRNGYAPEVAERPSRNCLLHFQAVERWYGSR